MAEAEPEPEQLTMTKELQEELKVGQAAYSGTGSPNAPGDAGSPSDTQATEGQ